MDTHRKQDSQIPVIDISAANRNAAQEILDAAVRLGFVFIANNDAGIPASSIDEMFDLSKRFFALSVDTKQLVSISSNKAGKNHGWLQQGVETLDPATQTRPDMKEAFNMGEPINGHLDQQLPILFQQHLDTLLAFQSACHDLCRRILELFAVALGIERNWFSSRHDPGKGPSGTVFRLLYYPQGDASEIPSATDLRAGAHSDYGSITCLFQRPGQPGLEIKTPSGKWASVPVDPSRRDDDNNSGGHSSGGGLPILVNIGDLLEDWTGGLLKSTVHRVVFPREHRADRYSMAYFCHPLDHALLEAVPSKIVQEHAARNGSRVNGASQKPITARDHLMERLAATYKIK